MAKPTDTVKPWATSGNYPASQYPLNLPWGVPSDVGGDPTPWSGLARIDVADITAFAAAGHTPQIPTSAEQQNRWLNTVYQCCAWVDDGTSAGDADAHIVETDSSGVITAVAVESQLAFQGLGGTKAPLANGATIPSGMDLELVGTASIVGTVTGTITIGTVDTTAGGVVTTNGVTFYADATPGGDSGQMQWDGFRMSIGLGAGAPEPMSAPIFDYKATASTTAAGTDIAGLDITTDVPDTRQIYITLEAHQEVDAVQSPLLRIRATNGVDSVAQLKIGQDDAAVSVLPTDIANSRRPNSVRVLWKPTDDFLNPDNTTWSFFAQHGVNALANLKTTAAVLKIEYR